jgi:HEAT repeat protein
VQAPRSLAAPPKSNKSNKSNKPQAKTSDVHELIRRLGSSNRKTVEGAMGRLAMIGRRAVDGLIDSLDGAPSVSLRAMELLSLIQDARAREPLAAMLLDADARKCGAAALALGRFPHPRTVAALGRTLERDRSERGSVSAIQALVSLYVAGQDAAVAPVLETLADSTRPKRVRLAALDLLPLLSAAERRDILERLANDPHPELSLQARAICDANSGRGSRATRDWIARLGSRNYSEWNEAVRRLGAAHDGALEGLLKEMQTRAHDPVLCTRAGMALKAMGPRRAGAISRALERFDDPLPLLVLIDVLAALGDRPSIYGMKSLIERLDARRREADGFDLLAGVAARAHLELARLGSRVAADRLLAALSDPTGQVEVELLSAAELIGSREEIGPLLDAWWHEEEAGRRRIGQVVRAILKREKIRRNDRAFKAMSAQRQQALRSLLPAAPRRPGRAASRATQGVSGS